MQVPNCQKYLTFTSEFIEAYFCSATWNIYLLWLLIDILPVKFVFSSSSWHLTTWWSNFFVSLLIPSFAIWSYCLWGSPRPHCFYTDAIIDDFIRSFLFQLNDSAKLRALCVYVLTCQRALCVHVPTYLACLPIHVSTCHASLRAHLSTCLACLHAHVPTCLACLRAHMPMCSRAQVPSCLSRLLSHVPTCIACLRTHVPTCLECLRASLVNMPWVRMYSCVNVACELTCSRANMPWVPCLIWLALLRDQIPTCFVSSVSSFDATFFNVTAIVVKVVHSVEFIHNPSLLIICRLKTRKYKWDVC